MHNFSGLPNLDQLNDVLERDLFPNLSGAIRPPYDELDVADDLSEFLRRDLPADKTSEARFLAIVEKLTTEMRWVHHWASELSDLGPKFNSLRARRECLEEQLESKELEREKIETCYESASRAITAHDRIKLDSINNDIIKIRSEISVVDRDLYEQADIKCKVDAGRDRLKSELLPVFECYFANYFEVEVLIQQEFQDAKYSVEKEIDRLKKVGSDRGRFSPMKVIDAVRIQFLKSSINNKLVEIRKRELSRVYPQLYKLSGMELSILAIGLLRRKYGGDFSSSKEGNLNPVVTRCGEIWGRSM
jgi:hypothetical protein